MRFVRDQFGELVMDQPIIPPELYLPRLLFSDPLRGGPFPPLYVAVGVLFGLLLVGGLLVYIFAPRLVRGHRLRARLLRQLSGWLAAIGGLGVFWVLCRAAELPLFARPLWLWFTFIALGAVIGYAVHYWRNRYPREFSAYEEHVRRRRWMPQPKRRAAARRR